MDNVAKFFMFLTDLVSWILLVMRETVWPAIQVNYQRMVDWFHVFFGINGMEVQVEEIPLPE